MPEIQIPSAVITGLQIILAFTGAFMIALWLSMIIWTFKDVRARSRDVFAILLATLMVVIFGPLGLLLYFLLRPPTTLAEQYERALEEEALLQDLEERPRCPGCSRQVNEAWILCPDCHNTLRKICPTCENSLHLQWNVCPFCGTHVPTAGAGPDDRRDQPGQPQPERVVEPVPHQQTRPMSEPVVTPPMAPPPPRPVASAPEEVAVPTPPSTRRGQAPNNDETRPFVPEAGPPRPKSIQDLADDLADRVTELVRPAWESITKQGGRR